MFKRVLVVSVVLALALVSTASAQPVAQVAVVGADDVKAQARRVSCWLICQRRRKTQMRCGTKRPAAMLSQGLPAKR